MFVEKPMKLFKNDFLRSSVFPTFLMVLWGSKEEWEFAIKPGTRTCGDKPCDADYKC